MKVFVLSVVFGVMLVTMVQAKSDKTPPKPATPATPSSAPASPAVSAPEPPWLQMEITPLEKEIVKQHLADIRCRCHVVGLARVGLVLERFVLPLQSQGEFLACDGLRIDTAPM